MRYFGFLQVSSEHDLRQFSQRMDKICGLRLIKRKTVILSGGHFRSGGHSRLTDDDGQEYEEQYIILPDYSFDTVELKLSRTRTAELDPEVTLEIE